jgi:hypothetical protein
MQRLWLITNPQSGSASEKKAEAIEAIFEERGLEITGRTIFPDEKLPPIKKLVEAGVDTIVLFAGDGTVNAAACKYDRWAGKALVLPGGTMNMLAKRLHGDADPHAIVHAAHEGGSEQPLPFVEAGPHRAFCGLIVGPAAAWAHAREAVRGGRLRSLIRAVRYAWLRTWSRGVTLFDGKRRRGDYRAVLISPEQGWVRVSAFATSTFMDAAKLGWEWLVGNWHNADSVDDTRSPCVRLTGEERLHALFDGEEVILPSPVEVSSGVSRLQFITTAATA